MKQRRTLLIVLILTLLLCGCSEKAALPEPTDTGIHVTDMAGETVILKEIPQRILALSPSDCEILFAIGAGEQVIGRGSDCDWPKEILELPEIVSGTNMNLEQVIALDPDVVLMSRVTQTQAQKDALEAAGITVIYSDAHDNNETLEGVYKAMDMLGTIAGREAEAQTLIEDTKNLFAQLQENIPQSSNKTVYFEVSPLEYGLWTAGPGTFMHEISDLLGVENIFSDLEGWCEVSEEQVLARNPDYIVSVTMFYGDGPSPEEEICSRTGWETITAVKNGSVMNFGNNELTRPGPRLAEGAKMLYDFFYGG